MQKKINALEKMTVENGASEQEEESAKKSIKRLLEKQNTGETTETEIEDIRPAHKANPPRCNWHIEKNGIILAKGNGVLKFSSVPDIYAYDRELEAWQRTPDRSCA